MGEFNVQSLQLRECKNAQVSGKNIERSYRINIGHLVAYSKRRKCLRALFSQLMGNNNSYATDFCHILDEIGKSQ